MTGMSFPCFHSLHIEKYYVIHKMLTTMLITQKSCENTCVNRNATPDKTPGNISISGKWGYCEKGQQKICV